MTQQAKLAEMIATAAAAAETVKLAWTIVHTHDHLTLCRNVGTTSQRVHARELLDFDIKALGNHLAAIDRENEEIF
jgi:hypothetical protein